MDNPFEFDGERLEVNHPILRENFAEWMASKGIEVDPYDPELFSTYEDEMVDYLMSAQDSE